MSYRLTWSIFAPLFLFGYAWICFKFIQPFLAPPTSVLYEPIGYIVAILFAGFMGLLIVFGHRYIEVIQLKNISFPHRLARSFFIGGAVLGFTVNHLTYALIIEPNAMIECPLKIGYKKNLLRDYVVDTSLCEKR